MQCCYTLLAGLALASCVPAYLAGLAARRHALRVPAIETPETAIRPTVVLQLLFRKVLFCLPGLADGALQRPAFHAQERLDLSQRLRNLLRVQCHNALCTSGPFCTVGIPADLACLAAWLYASRMPAIVALEKTIVHCAVVPLPLWKCRLCLILLAEVA